MKFKVFYLRPGCCLWDKECFAKNINKFLEKHNVLDVKSDTSSTGIANWSGGEMEHQVFVIVKYKEDKINEKD